MMLFLGFLFFFFINFRFQMPKLRTIMLAVFAITCVAAAFVWAILRHSGPSVPDGVVSVRVQLRPSSILHVWLKAHDAHSGARIVLRHADAKNLTVETHGHREFEWHAVALGLEGAATLEWHQKDTSLSYIYVFEPESVLDEGIRPAYIADAARLPEVREGYHFRPPLGWMNDPNGFSKFGGRFHLFYQHYPHAQHWAALHWGHAVSRDLINWVHLPVFMAPDPRMALDHPDIVSGLCSGSAYALPGTHLPTLGLFFTNCLPGRTPQEFQQMVTTVDGILPSQPASTLIPQPPPGNGLTQDFRDPHVFMGPDGRLKMILGSSDGHGGVILLYETGDPQGTSDWRFAGVLHRDPRRNTRVAECPELLRLRKSDASSPPLWLLNYGALDARDPLTGRRDLTPALVGTFDGARFDVLFEQELDFAAGAYAYQGFYEPGSGETLLIGWMANWKDYDYSGKTDFPTAMTVPRRVKLNAEGTALLTPPIDLTSLRELHLDDGRMLQRGDVVALPKGTAEIRLELDQKLLDLANGGVLLELLHPEGPLGVSVSAEGLEIVTHAPHTRAQRMIALGARPIDLLVLLDTGALEVFGDGGRWAGTYRVPGFNRFTGTRLNGDLHAVTRAEVWSLRGAEFRGLMES